MSNIYNAILKSKIENEKLLAILLDPDKIELSTIALLVNKINQSPATHIFIGGSLVENDILDELILKIRQFSSFEDRAALPIVLFPGNPSQISNQADALLFLTLISGRNPDFLIEHQVNAVPILKKTQLEIISTGYLLIESGTKTAVERISNTTPLARNNPNYVLQTALAGEMLGNKLIYLETGSGAKQAVPLEMIQLVSSNCTIPVLVGGGIKDRQGIQKAFDSGADMVVIGTAFENNVNFFDK